MNTKKELEMVFAEFCKVIGGRIAIDHKDVGGYVLENHKPANIRQYRIGKICNNLGATSDPFGPYNYSAKGLIAMMRFTIKVVEEKNRLKQFN